MTPSYNFNEKRELSEAVFAHSSLHGFADQPRKEVNYRAPGKNGFLEYQFRGISKVVFKFEEKVENLCHLKLTKTLMFFTQYPWVGYCLHC